MIVCFDVGGTLVDAHDGFVSNLLKLARGRLPTPHFRRLVSLAKRSAEEDLRALAEQCALDFDTVFEVWAQTRKRQPRLFDDVLPTLRALSHLKVIGLSNAARWTVHDVSCLEPFLGRHAPLFLHEIGFAKARHRGVSIHRTNILQRQ